MNYLIDVVETIPLYVVMMSVPCLIGYGIGRLAIAYENAKRRSLRRLYAMEASRLTLQSPKSPFQAGRPPMPNVWTVDRSLLLDTDPCEIIEFPTAK